MKEQYSSYPEYKVWVGIKQRCYNPKNNGFDNYGGMGIKMCDRWRTSFSAFIEDMGRRPVCSEIHRLNENGDYEPDNCIWMAKDEHATQPRRPKRDRSMTKRQDDIYTWVTGQKVVPSIREIADQFGMSVKGAYDHVKAIERKGYWRVAPVRARGIEIV